MTISFNSGVQHPELKHTIGVCSCKPDDVISSYMHTVDSGGTATVTISNRPPAPEKLEQQEGGDDE